MKHIARKRFGQHFLTDPSVIEAIVRCIDPRGGQSMVEIGPGLAALTQPLVERVGHLSVIELDRDLAQHLRQHPQLTVIEADVLKVDFAQLAGSHADTRWRVVGNLPYNISTPILFHLLDHAEHVIDQHFMLQKEVVERMVALPSTAAYGRLSVMLQWRYDMDLLMHIGPEAFEPPPKVDSAIVRMVPKTQPLPLAFDVLSELVQVAFSQRRKLLRHTLGVWLQQKGLDSDFDLQRRAEEVPALAYWQLAQAAVNQ